jgi:7-cyano-7-deazaguanine synthase in queuosine biosynthesis
MMLQANSRSVAITFSGGIDSTVLAYYFCSEQGKFDYLSPTPKDKSVKTKVYLLQARIGHAANYTATRELLDYHWEELTKRYKDRFEFYYNTFKVKLPKWSGKALNQEGYVPIRHRDNPLEKTFTELGPDVFIDGRNAIFHLWLASYCSKHNIPTLLTGHQLEEYEFDELDTYRARTEDVGPYFIDRLNLMTEVGFKNRVKISAPWLDMRLSKYHIVKIGRELGVDLENKTYSCYFYPPCGKCGNCIIRQKALTVIASKAGFSQGKLL